MAEVEGAVGVSDADEARNRVFGAGVVDDPYPTYHDLRSACPVHAAAISDGFPAMSGFRALTPEGVPVFSTYGYETAVDVLRRSDDFASEPFYAGLASSIGPTVISMDEPEHRRMRNLVQPAFARREMERWKATIIRPIVDEHIDRIAAAGRADIYKAIGATVPIHTISAALGLPVADRERFFGWAVAMTSTVLPPEERVAASQAVADYVAPHVADRRREPRDDLLTTLVQATVPVEAGDDVDRRPLSDDEIGSFVRLFIIAGASTTFRAYGLLMYHLLTHPEQLAAVAADRGLVDGAIDEALRIEQPLAFIGRMTARPCELGGATLPAGALVEVAVGAANHDPGAYPDPEAFDVRRPRADRHLTFGFGIHRCLGVHLAEAELAVMLERTLDRLPELRLDPDADVHLTGLGFRMVTGLPVTFRPTTAA
jgi:cytochrome P450